MPRSAEGEYEDAIEHYAGIFPEEIREATKAFDNRVRQAILGALLCEGELSFTELRNLLRLKNNRMWPHLKALERGGLIENFFRDDFKERRYSFYRISPYGQKFVKSLFESLSTTGVLVAPLLPTYSRSLKTDAPVLLGEGGVTVVWTPSRIEFADLKTHITIHPGPPLRKVIYEPSERSAERS
ncbi:winged helix-turn-helix domain-containing protein [Candidatus Pyrohabitans sp.]